MTATTTDRRGQGGRGDEVRGPGRLSLDPDCGFAPGIGAEIPLEEAYLKVRNEAEAARLRDKYG